MSINIKIDFKPVKNLFDQAVAKFNIWYLLLISFALHLFSIGFPSDGGLIFDETYYVPAAENTLKGIAANAEQMPLAKIMVALSIKIFGDYWFAWRFPILICCMISLYAFYLIAKQFMTERYALYAAALLSFDIIFFVHGSIFVLDMPSIAFGLLGIYLYLTKRYSWSAFSFAVSFLMYAVALLFLAAVVLYHIFTHINLKKMAVHANYRKFLTFLLIFLAVSGGGLWLYEAVYKPSSATTITQNVAVNVYENTNSSAVTTVTNTVNSTSNKIMDNPISQLAFQWSYFSSLSTTLQTPASQYRPAWTWILPVGNSLNPPHYYTVAVTANGVTHTTIDWVSQITPFVEYFLIPILIVALIYTVSKRDKENTGKFLIAWIFATFMPFLALSVIAYPNWTNFNYYMLDTIPACALGIPYFWDKVVKNNRTRWAIMGVQIALVILFFFYYFPVKLIQ